MTPSLSLTPPEESLRTIAFAGAKARAGDSVVGSHLESRKNDSAQRRVVFLLLVFGMGMGAATCVTSWKAAQAAIQVSSQPAVPPELGKLMSEAQVLKRENAALRKQLSTITNTLSRIETKQQMVLTSGKKSLK